MRAFDFYRSLYHVVEMTEGWHGRIIQTQTYFGTLFNSHYFVGYLLLKQLCSMAP